MLRMWEAELDLAAEKIQFYLTEIYFFLKYFYMPATTGMAKRSWSWTMFSRD